MELDVAVESVSSNGKHKTGEEEDNEDVPPAKKTKLEQSKQPAPVSGTKKPPKCPDFLVGNLEDFYRPYPSFRQPSEIGFFSFNEKGEMILDRSGMRYFSQPSRLGLDLKVGYPQFQPKLNQSPDLANILRWISNRWECFLPKLKNQKSLEEIPPHVREGISTATTTSLPIIKDTPASKLVLF